MLHASTMQKNDSQQNQEDGGAGRGRQQISNTDFSTPNEEHFKPTTYVMKTVILTLTVTFPSKSKLLLQSSTTDTTPRATKLLVQSPRDLFYRLDINGGFPASSAVKKPSTNAGNTGSISGLGSSLWRRKWQPTPVFLPGKSHGQRSLVGHNPQGHKRVGHNLATKQQQHFILQFPNFHL